MRTANAYDLVRPQLRCCAFRSGCPHHVSCNVLTVIVLCNTLTYKTCPPTHPVNFLRPLRSDDTRYAGLMPLRYPNTSRALLANSKRLIPLGHSYGAAPSVLTLHITLYSTFQLFLLCATRWVQNSRPRSFTLCGFCGQTTGGMRAPCLFAISNALQTV